MSYEYVIDSYAWVEYFKGSPRGSEARRFVEGDKAATSAVTVAELREKYRREGWKTFDADSAFLSTRAPVAPVTREIAVLAGEINHRQKARVKGWGMADSIILATARAASAKVVTGDQHFRRLEDAVMI